MEKIFDQILEELKGLREGQARLEARLDSLDVRMDSLDARMDNLDVRMDSLDARMDNLDARMDSLDTRMDGLEVKVIGLKEGQTCIESRLNAVYDQVVENCEKLTENEMKFDMFKDLWFKHEQEIHKLKKKTG